MKFWNLLQMPNDIQEAPILTHPAGLKVYVSEYDESSEGAGESAMMAATAVLIIH